MVRVNHLQWRGPQRRNRERVDHDVLLTKPQSAAVEPDLVAVAADAEQLRLPFERRLKDRVVRLHEPYVLGVWSHSDAADQMAIVMKIELVGVAQRRDAVPQYVLVRTQDDGGGQVLLDVFARDHRIARVLGK